MKVWHYIVSRTSPQGGAMILRMFSDGADAYRFAERLQLSALDISMITDASSDVNGQRRPHQHYWAIKSWVWENYRWENREPTADCLPLKDACPCGLKRPHVEGTPWPPAADSPMPGYEIVRSEAGPRPRKSRAKARR